MVRTNIRGALTTRPRNRDIWIRLDGEWQAAWITMWMKLGDQWFATVEYDPPNGARQVGNYWFDPEAIVPRADGERPVD